MIVVSIIKIDNKTRKGNSMNLFKILANESIDYRKFKLFVIKKKKGVRIMEDKSLTYGNIIMALREASIEVIEDDSNRGFEWDMYNDDISHRLLKYAPDRYAVVVFYDSRFAYVFCQIDLMLATLIFSGITSKNRNGILRTMETLYDGKKVREDW